jgi:putative transposase
MDRTSDGRPLRILIIIDEYTRECLSMHVSRRIRSEDVLDQLYELFLIEG